ncbi:MAG: hypothetical protein H7839_02000 [Magnetococcus sp. YQC-5]
MSHAIVLSRSLEKKEWMVLVILFLTILYAYIGVVAFVAYVMAGWYILFGKGNLLLADLIFCLVFGIFATINIYFIEPVEWILLNRFYLGFCFFYLFIQKKSVIIDIDNLLLVLCCLTIVDLILVNFLIAPEMMPNYPVKDGQLIHSLESFGGAYNRPYSFGGSASVTSCILVALLASSKSKRLIFKLFVFLTVFVVYSGTGYGALFVYLIFKNRIFAFLVFVLILFGVIGVMQVGDDYQKLDPQYFLFLIDFKIQQFNELIPNMPSWRYLFGFASDSYGGRGGDFGLLTFFLGQGLILAVLFLAFFVKKLNRYNALPLLILFIGTLHYSVIFYYVGQFIFAYFLNYGGKGSSVAQLQTSS